MFYEKRMEEDLKEEIFRDPPKSYRGAPFWAWNTKLCKEALVKQIKQFKEMGFGGFHIHCRVGLDTQYLGKDFFECVQACLEEANKENLYSYLYDEDRWPSGSAGGIVTRNKSFRTRFLVFSPLGFEEKTEGSYMAAAKAVRSKERKHLGYYSILLKEDGCLESYERLENLPEKENQMIWEAVLEISGDTPWFNDQAYVNTLDKAAIRQFIEVTHEQYYKRFEKEFGKSIRSIFTDEPQTCHKEIFQTPFSFEQIMIPFSDEFDKSFLQKYGYSLLDRLPELFWEPLDYADYETRYHYHVHVLELFSECFGDQIGTWCKTHKINLTGHMMNEWTLHSQTMAIGECMRPMKEFGIPGVDMLCDRREYSTVKQAASVAHQQGCEGVMSELYGVTGWGFDFRNHKLSGDWQAALGVTFRVPHLTWVSMEGEAKRDYPACIGRHSPWYRHYRLIEDHFARVNTALTRGKPIVRIGVIHPIESYWMYWGNRVQTSSIRQTLEDNFSNIIEWLLFGLIDFDFISEALLEMESGTFFSKKFSVGKMQYDTIIIPECITLRRSTVNKLKDFLKAGGEVIFLGKIPEYIDGKKSTETRILAEKAIEISFNKADLLRVLEHRREVDVQVSILEGVDPTRISHREKGIRSENLFYQLREDGENKWLFLCHVNKMPNEHIAYLEKWKIYLKGIYKPILYDTLTGVNYPIKADYENNKTLISHVSSQHGSLLLKLIPGKAQQKKEQEYLLVPEAAKLLPEPTQYSLLETNCMLLDQAEYSFDEEEWHEKEELLRIDNKFRKKLGYPLRMEALAQPWTKEEQETATHKLRLKFEIYSEVFQPSIELAMENPHKVQIIWNGKEIIYEDTGFYVDESIRKCLLMGLKKGKNILFLSIPFGRKTNIEWMYLLGAFGVSVTGKMSKITALPEKICYGNLVGQKLDFYGGSLEYKTEVFTEEGELCLEISHYRAALLWIFLDGQDKGPLFLAPYRKNLGYVRKGKHIISIRIYGNRINTFGAVHNADISEKWYGPNLWRTTGSKWSYEYQLEEMGILTSPVYWIKKRN